MKKYLIAGAALVASLSSAAFAENFTGPYAGLTLGANSFNSGYSQSSANTGGGSSSSSNSNAGATLFNHAIYAGYGHTFGQYYVGGEFLFAMQSGEAKATGTNGNNTGFANATIKEGYSFNPTLRLGALIAPKTLAFIKLGVAGTQMKVNAQPFSFPEATNLSTSYKKTLWGYSIGAGMETLVTDSISVRADYTCNIYPTKTFTITNTNAGNVNQGKISPQDNIFRVGAAYHFSF
ncbi:MAG: hypothetical protein B7Y25_04495 [Alphaproteobacteria bacterium 16-39-46]|nr:MAG: hypothetical protein B7Y25_04495 [Alphaproteobacteria bacterium 16-39-46]OZA42990.1 MAG: hypothetical protein B7X84_04415 [Alphaproteobacteria bacterium 17-39-52]